MEATKALRLRHGDEAKRTHMLLEMTNKHVIQPLATTDPKKGFLVSEPKPFLRQVTKGLIALWK